MKEKIVEIVCPTCMYGCDCLIRGKSDMTKCPTINAMKALIEQEQQPMREALESIKSVAEIELDEYVSVEVPYIPMRLLGYKQLYNIADAVLGGSHE